MDCFTFRLILYLAKKEDIFHHSYKQYLEISDIAKFGSGKYCKMFGKFALVKVGSFVNIGRPIARRKVLLQLAGIDKRFLHFIKMCTFSSAQFPLLVRKYFRSKNHFVRNNLIVIQHFHAMNYQLVSFEKNRSFCGKIQSTKVQ